MIGSEESSPLAVCIVNYGGPELLERCIDSVLKCFQSTPIVVHVWDNKSNQSAKVQQRASRRPYVRWHFSSLNIGFAAAANRLATISSPADLLLLNPDAELRQPLDAVYEVLKTEKVAAVAPRVSPFREDGRGRPWDCAHRKQSMIRSLISYAGYADRLRGTPLSDLYGKPPEEVDGYLTGACLFVSRRAWQVVGEFDERFFLYGEESDWQARARRSGFRLILAGSKGPVPVLHSAQGTVRTGRHASLRSRDLLRAAHLLFWTKYRGVRAGNLLAFCLAILDRVQRSKRRDRARVGIGERRVRITTNTLNYGGAERQRTILAGGLAEKGYSCELLCLQQIGPLIANLPTTVRLALVPYWHPLIAPMRNVVVITGTTRTEIAFGLFSKYVARNRWVVAIHNPPKIVEPTFGLLQAAVMRLSDQTVTLGKAHLSDLNRSNRISKFVQHIPNGVGPAQSGFPLTEAAPIGLRLGTVGRITTPKNQLTLIRALGELADYDWTLQIYGDGPCRAEFESAVPFDLRDRIRWCGWAQDADEAMRNIDILCVPSNIEAMPLVVLEAMARRRAVIATATCTVPELLDNGRCGVLVPTGKRSDWVTALRSILQDPDNLAPLVEAAYMRWKQNYSVQHMIDGYVELLAADGYHQQCSSNTSNTV